MYIYICVCVYIYEVQDPKKKTFEFLETYHLTPIISISFHIHLSINIYIYPPDLLSINTQLPLVIERCDKTTNYPITNWLSSQAWYR